MRTTLEKIHSRCKELCLRFSEKRNIGIPLFFAIVVGMVVLQYFFPTEEYDIWPPCPIHWCTGIHCPGCGCTRAISNLLRGDLAGSLSMNLMFAPIILILSALVIWPKLLMNRFFTVPVEVVLLLFCLLRNLPWEPFSLLAPH